MTDSIAALSGNLPARLAPLTLRAGAAYGPLVFQPGSGVDFDLTGCSISSQLKSSLGPGVSVEVEIINARGGVFKVDMTDALRSIRPGSYQWTVDLRDAAGRVIPMLAANVGVYA